MFHCILANQDLIASGIAPENCASSAKLKRLRFGLKGRALRCPCSSTQTHMTRPFSSVSATYIVFSLCIPPSRLCDTFVKLVIEVARASNNLRP